MKQRDNSITTVTIALDRNLCSSYKTLVFKLCLLFFLLASSLFGGITITFIETEGDVVSTYSGTLDTSDPNIFDISELNRFAPKFNPSLGYYANPPGDWRTAAGSYVIDASNSNSPFYDGPREGSGQGFGSGTETEPTTVTGDAFGIFQNSLVLPEGWTSGSEVSGQMTWENTTFAELGYDSSQDHVWTLRGTEDIITMTAIPEPSTYGLVLGFIALLLAGYRKSANFSAE